MSIVQTLIYDVSGNYSFDSDSVEFSAGKARLKLIDNPSQPFTETFDSDSDFVYDPDLTEFVAGVMRQVDQRPANATLYASFDSSLDANWANGSQTGTASGGAAISGNKLNLSGGGGAKYLDFAGAGNISVCSMTGTVRFNITPNYNGTPTDNQTFFSIEDSNSGSNKIQLFHATNGSFFILMNDENGTNILSNSILSFDAVAGTTSEVELSWDLNAGKVRVFGQGYMVVEIDVDFTRSTNVDRFRLGSSDAGTNIFIDHVLLFSTVQHTATYVPSSYPTDRAYASDLITLPTFTYAGLGDLQSFDSASITDAGSPRYIVNGKYWNGSAWVVSNETYAQAVSSTTLNAQIDNLVAAETLLVKVITPDQNSQASVSTFNVSYTGEIYPTNDPTIVNNSPIASDGLVSFASTFTASGADSVRFILGVNNQDKYWNGSAWVSSNGTLAQSNTSQNILDHALALDLDGGANIKVKVILHSDDGSSTPEIEDVTLTYDFFEISAAAPGKCIVYCFLNDQVGAISSVRSAVLEIELTTGFKYGDRFIAPFTRTFSFDAEGYLETTSAYLQTEDLSATDGLVETESGELSPYNLSLQYRNLADKLIKVEKKNVQIPDQLSVNLVDLFFPD